jgi:hypothetical protein
VIEYWFDRFLLSPFVPAALLLAFVASWAGSHDLGGFLLGCVVGAPIALLVLAQLRLWDDLADRDRDRREHPERVLCEANPAPFIATAVGLAIVNAWLLWSLGGPRFGLKLLGLYGAVAVFYLLRPHHPTAVSTALLLAKYPALLLVLAPAPTDHVALAIAMLAIYASVFTYEVWHDPTGPLGARHS